MLPLLDERQRRIYLAVEAQSYGWGGISRVSEISGVAPFTIRQGIAELNGEEPSKPTDRLRAAGGGRKKLETSMPDLDEHILQIVDGSTYGNPEKVLSYTTMSLRAIQQNNQKMLQVGDPHPDRNQQFEFINNKSARFLKQGLPVISVDTKKKENIGNFKNNGQEYRKSGDPLKVWDHDFPILELGKVAPYGVYVLNDNTGFVNLGTDHDTAEFAAESILRWWTTVGQNTFPNADKIYINCDNGGSNGSRLHLWKYELQQLANITGLEINVSHFPPGTSKWNKIEHRLFCYISKTWQGQPLIDIETVVQLISSTTTSKGLKVICQVDNNKYALGQKISDEEYNKIRLFPGKTLGDWNYIIKPQK